MGRTIAAAAFAALIVLAISASASAKPTSTYVLFKNGHAYCTAVDWTSRANGFVACSARIGGAWQNVVLQRTGRAFTSHQAAAPASRYQQLRTRWRGGPFLLHRCHRWRRLRVHCLGAWVRHLRSRRHDEVRARPSATRC